MANITGNSLNNVLRSNVEADVIIGGDGNDTVDYSVSKAVTVNLNVAVQSGGDAQGDRLIQIENVTGSAFNDKITGDYNDNILSGGGGSDILDGGKGNDVLIGGIDGVTDSLDGGYGIDGVSYSSSTYAVTVALGLNSGWGTTTALETFGGLQRTVIEDKMINIENVDGSNFDDKITGNEADNVLNGGGGNDWLSGGDGADRLDGGAGADRLVGGAGADVFVFQSAADIGTAAAHDFVEGFRGGQDKIDLSAVDAIAGTTANDVFHFSASGSTLDGTAGALAFTTAGSDDLGQNWRVTGDTNGDGQADFTLSVHSSFGNGMLTMNDFIL
jgi:Ca2+-binding RTX toxin-like protein